MTSIRNSLSASRLWNSDNYNVSGYVSNAYSPPNKTNSTDGSISGQYDGDIFDADSYFSFDSKNNYGASVGFSNTQILSDGNLYLTPEKGNSYLLVDLESDSNRLDNDDVLKGQLIVKNKNRGFTKKSIYDNKTVVKLTEFEPYQLDLDTEIADLYSVGDKYVSGYSYPSGVIKLNTKIGLTNRVVAGFKDIFDQPIKDLVCEGIGCVGMSNIVAGVYNITLAEKMPYILKSESQVCELNIVDEKVNYGNNYCFPKLLVGQSKVSKNEFGQIKIIRYLGEFYRDPGIIKALDVFDDDEVKMYFQEKRYSLSVYISYDEEVLMGRKQKDLIESLVKFSRANSPISLGKVNEEL